MHHDVRAIKCRAVGIVIEKGTAGSENIPRVVDVKIHHAQPQGKVNAGDRLLCLVNDNELPLRKNLAVILEFFGRVGFLGGIDHFANFNDGLIVRGIEVADSIVGRKVRRLHNLDAQLLLFRQ
jgi:hypothetical protein